MSQPHDADYHSPPSSWFFAKARTVLDLDTSVRSRFSLSHTRYRFSFDITEYEQCPKSFFAVRKIGITHVIRNHWMWTDELTLFLSRDFLRSHGATSFAKLNCGGTLFGSAKHVNGSGSASFLEGEVPTTEIVHRSCDSPARFSRSGLKNFPSYNRKCSSNHSSHHNFS